MKVSFLIFFQCPSQYTEDEKATYRDLILCASLALVGGYDSRVRIGSNVRTNIPEGNTNFYSSTFLVTVRKHFYKLLLLICRNGVV